ISGYIENFAKLMNQPALELGCTHTHFTNPSGIHDVNHYSTAYDMALIAKYCMRNETFRNIVNKKSCKFSATDLYPEERYFKNTNSLLDSSNRYYYEYAIGIKTGFTTQAKNCLIAGAKKDGIELIAVMLGAEATENGQSGRYVDAKNLFNFGFENYEIKKFLNEGTKVAEIKVKNATKDTQTLNLIANASLSTTFQSNFDTTSLIPSIEIKENISAPIAKDAILGKISYNIDGIIYEADLIAENDVIKSNFIETLLQILLAIIVLILIAEFFSHKRKKQKNNKKNLRKNSSVYKFNLE
ncbi:MAG: D-alanyl-D-alanine carboxypeptidase family protein, partial [Clostridia bacterium]